MQPLKWLRKLSRSERGNAMIVCAATLPLVVGAAAIGVDTIQVTLAKRQMQRAADSAALAGVYALVQNTSVNTAVTRDLGLNNDVTLSAAPVIQNAPTVGSYAGNPRAVRVVLTAQRPVPFWNFFSDATMTVTVEATAARIYQGEYCAISLEDQNTTGISMGGNASLDLGCGMITNSRSSNAAYAFGNATINASPIAAVGGIPETNNYNASTIFLPYSPSQADPLAGLPTPVVPSSGCQNRLNVQPNDTYTIPTTDAVPGQPGVYCYRGMDIKGTVTLQPGIYYIDGSALSFGAQANVTANGVTFILTSSTATTNAASIADIDVNGGATIHLTAPTDGTYAGVAMYMDRRAPMTTQQINGNSATTYRGAFYFPGQELVFNGTADMHSECMQLIGRRLTFSGNAHISNTCPSGSNSHGYPAQFVRLVG